MITVNVIGDKITGFVNGEPFGVSFTEEKFTAMKALEAKAAAVTSMDELKAVVEEFKPLTDETYSAMIKHTIAGEYLVVNPKNNRIYLTVNGKVSAEPLPQAFVDRIITSVEKKIDAMPLVKAWARFLRCPNYSATKATYFANYINNTYVNTVYRDKLIAEKGLDQRVATEMATTMDVAITQEGLLNTYKVSTEITHRFVKDENSEDGVKKVDRHDYDVDDITGLKTYKLPDHVEDRVFQPAVMNTGGDAFSCGSKLGHVIRVGEVHALPSWDMVDCNDGRSCVKGLHVGGLKYIDHYQHEGTVTHNIFVDPMDIGAFDHSGNGAIRVLRYFVHSSFAGANKNIYHSSEYAKITDAEYRKLFDEAVSKSEQKAADAKALLDGRNLL